MEQTFKFDADKVLAFAESAILETAVLAKAKEAEKEAKRKAKEAKN